MSHKHHIQPTWTQPTGTRYTLDTDDEVVNDVIQYDELEEDEVSGCDDDEEEEEDEVAEFEDEEDDERTGCE